MLKKIVVLTGAGMSAESGIATFRDSNGLWNQHSIEDVATPEGFERNPQLVLDFYNKRRKETIEALPNLGHELLAELEQDYEVTIITQNVDNLHEKAGSSNVLHLHGELMKVRSSLNPQLVYTLSHNKLEINLGDKCELGSQLRPHIVWFGEAVPMMDEAIKIVEKADIFIIIGTSLNVYPAASLIHYAKKGVPIYLIDPHPVNINRNSVQLIQKGGSEGMLEIKRILDNQR